MRTFLAISGLLAGETRTRSLPVWVGASVTPAQGCAAQRSTMRAQCAHSPWRHRLRPHSPCFSRACVHKPLPFVSARPEQPLARAQGSAYSGVTAPRALDPAKIAFAQSQPQRCRGATPRGNARNCRSPVFRGRLTLLGQSARCSSARGAHVGNAGGSPRSRACIYRKGIGVRPVQFPCMQ